MNNLNLNFYWVSSPFLRLLAPFIIGILLFSWIQSDLFLLFLIVSLATIFTHNYLSQLKKTNQIIFSVGVFVSFVLLSYLITRNHNLSIIENTQVTAHSYSGKVIGKSVRESYTQYIVEASQHVESERDNIFNQKIILRYPNSDTDIDLNDHILFKTKLSEISAIKNPLGFDARRYWNNKGIKYSGYADYSMTLISKYGPVSVISKIRNYISALIDTGFKTLEAKGVAKALMLGDKSELDPDIKSTFMDAGAMHVLAVSGLHVGLVASLFGILLYPIGRVFPNKRRMLYLFVLIPVWCFAAVCNFSPSVTRASIMISFFLAADASHRQYLGINILSLTALILLCYNPNYLYDIGFQLSFAAVFGLLVIYKPIRNLYFPKTRVSRYIWNLICVTVAVQIFLIPILFYYFHRFPIFFIPNSLIAVSGLGIILSAGFAMIFFSWQAEMLEIFTSIFEFLILGLNKLLSLNNYMPINNIENIWIDPLELMLLFFMSFGLVIFLNTNYQDFKYFILPFLVFSAYHGFKSADKKEHTAIASYSTPYHTSIELFVNQKSYSFTSAKKINPYVNGNLRSKFDIVESKDFELLDQFQDKNILASSGLIFTADLKVLILSDRNFKELVGIPPQDIDYLFINKKLSYSIEKLLSRHNVKSLVIDCSSGDIKIPEPNKYEILNACDSGWIISII